MIATNNLLEPHGNVALPKSRKVHVPGKLHPDIRVPFREITLSHTRLRDGHVESNAPVRVYDCGGPWTDEAFHGNVEEGLPAIRQLISEGININVTLLFSLSRYREVAEAYIAGMEDRCNQGKPLRHVASVASFFLSRIDTLVDPILEKIIKQNSANAVLAVKLQGQVAVASAKAAYQIYKELFFCERFQKLMDKGALVQRLLWASTGTKNPQYSDVKYVDAIIAPNTVNTIPLETINAYRDHGQPGIRIEDELAAAMDVFKSLPELGINIDQVTQQLEDEGVEKFNKPFDNLLQILERKALEVKKPEGA